MILYNNNNQKFLEYKKVIKKTYKKININNKISNMKLIQMKLHLKTILILIQQ